MKIESNIPLPPVVRGRPRKYPFFDMQVGDSFAIPLLNQKDAKGQDKAVTLLRSAGNGHGNRYGQKFIVRTDRVDNIARCWRVA